MRKGGGQAKGSANERRSNKELSLWWSDGKDADLFTRTQERGDRAIAEETGDSKARKEEGFSFLKIFCVEFKHYANIDLLELLEDKKGKIFQGWCKQVLDNSKVSGREPFLYFRRNFHKPYVAISESTYLLLFGSDLPDDWLVYHSSSLDKIMIIMSWESFIHQTSPTEIKEVYKNDR